MPIKRILSRVTDLVELGVNSVDEMVGQWGNLDEKKRDACETAVAVAAGLTIGANGSYKDAERAVLEKIVSRHRLTKLFDMTRFHQVVEEVAGDVIEVSLEFGIDNHKDALNVLKRNAALGQVAVFLCVEIAASDEDFDADEATTVKIICEAAGQNIRDFPKLMDALSGSRPAAPAPAAPSAPTAPSKPAASPPPASSNPEDGWS